MIRKPVLAAFAACLLFGSGFTQAAEKEVAAEARAALAAAPSISLDKTTLDNGGVITITGQAAPGKPVVIEVFNENRVTGSYFDKTPDKETGKIPYKLYIANDIPAFYRTLVQATAQPVLDKFKKDGRGWSYSAALKEVGGDLVYLEPGKRSIDGFQASMASSMAGSRGDPLPALDKKEVNRRSMQILKARYRSVDNLLAATVEQKDDGTFTAKLKIPAGAPPGKYFITAATDKIAQSLPATVENNIAFPMRYMSNAGTSLNIFIPFLVAFALATFGVLMGAGGGFIINPVLLMLFPLPHNVVAGTVTPTVLFSQGSGVFNYSKIKFISWKVGVIMGMAMLAGAFIGPSLTQLISLDEFKSVFGYIRGYVLFCQFAANVCEAQVSRTPCRYLQP